MVCQGSTGKVFWAYLSQRYRFIWSYVSRLWNCQEISLCSNQMRLLLIMGCLHIFMNLYLINSVSNPTSTLSFDESLMKQCPHVDFFYTWKYILKLISNISYQWPNVNSQWSFCFQLWWGKTVTMCVLQFKSWQ